MAAEGGARCVGVQRFDPLSLWERGPQALGGSLRSWEGRGGVAGRVPQALGPPQASRNARRKSQVLTARATAIQRTPHTTVGIPVN